MIWIIWNYMKLHKMIWNDMKIHKITWITWNDINWHEWHDLTYKWMAWNFMTWNDKKLHDMKWNDMNGVGCIYLRWLGRITAAQGWPWSSWGRPTPGPPERSHSQSMGSRRIDRRTSLMTVPTGLNRVVGVDQVLDRYEGGRWQRRRDTNKPGHEFGCGSLYLYCL
jgi:hypothetical protein